MRRRLPGVLLVLAAAAALPGCASGDPWTPPQAAPQRTMRTPVVAPSGPVSPFWWPLPDSWWPFY